MAAEVAEGVEEVTVAEVIVVHRAARAVQVVIVALQAVRIDRVQVTAVLRAVPAAHQAVIAVLQAAIVALRVVLAALQAAIAALQQDGCPPREGLTKGPARELSRREEQVQAFLNYHQVIVLGREVREYPNCLLVQAKDREREGQV